jgi:hypothetical protein
MPLLHKAVLIITLSVSPAIPWCSAPPVIYQHFFSTDETSIILFAGSALHPSRDTCAAV